MAYLESHMRFFHPRKASGDLSLHRTKSNIWIALTDYGRRERDHCHVEDRTTHGISA
jgi:hypothetical protein